MLFPFGRIQAIIIEYYKTRNQQYVVVSALGSGLEHSLSLAWYLSIALQTIPSFSY